MDRLIYCQDYLTTGHIAPTEDQKQDANLMYAMERDGRTIISYSRKRDTGDANQDLPIEVSTYNNSTISFKKFLKWDLWSR